ncbi:MAG: M23 family metallopeptidase [Myxococcaceae bacterium]|nr:MAG: M23 family metallopeptidase [Myxococcaceae bacterium]
MRAAIIVGWMAVGVAPAAQAACVNVPNLPASVHYELPAPWTTHGDLYACGVHKGIDFKIGYNAPVYAVAAGTVVAKGNEACHGKWIVLRHPDGVYSAYAHLLSIPLDLDPGDAVGLQTEIARSGYTGTCVQPPGINGSHLHLSMSTNWIDWNSSSFFDPKPYIGLRN